MSEIKISLPTWLDEVLESAGQRDYSRLEDRMALAVELSARNIDEGTGGPFGAVVFDRRTHRLVTGAVNVVVSNAQALAHAEVMALSRAQSIFKTHDLGPLDLELVTSAQPCLLCFGAFWWSGPRSLACGARASDVEALTGFQEGPLVEDWVRRLEIKGVQVFRDILRKEACEVLSRYSASGGQVYNPS